MHGRTAQGFREAVVAAATGQSVLRPELPAHDLKSRPDVIVETPHQPWNDRIGDARFVEKRLHFAEMLRAFRTKVIRNDRQRLDVRLAAFDLAVENPQTVC